MTRLSHLADTREFKITGAQLQHLIADMNESYITTHDPYYLGQRDAFTAIYYGWINPVPERNDLSASLNTANLDTKPMRLTDHAKKETTY